MRAVQVTAFLTLFIGVVLGSHSGHDDSDADVINLLFSKFNVDDFRSTLLQYVEESLMDDALLEDLENELNNMENAAGANCVQCRSLVGSLKTLIRNGNTFEDVRDLAISVCVSIANGQNYLGDIICPGIIDNFGPEIHYVLNVTDADHTANEICELYRACDPSQQKDTVPGIWKAPRQLKPKQNRNYDDLLKVVHVTDVHVDQDYFEGGPSHCNLPLCCREGYNGTGSAEYWGNYECGVPTHTVESFLRQLAEHDPQMIFYTGDSPPHAIWLETQWGQIDDSRYLAQVLGDIFPDIPSFTTLGNHDTFPVNVYGRNRPDRLTEELNEALNEYWAPVSGFGPEQEESFKYGGYYSMAIRPGLRVICYNSNYGTTDNFFAIIPIDNGEIDEMLDFLSNEFESARLNNEKVILLGHHPNGGSARFRFYESFLYELTRDYGDITILHLDGHSHKDRFVMTIDKDTGVPQNAWISSPTMGSKTDKNPSARIFYLDPDTFEPVDFDNVFFNLTAVMLDNPEIEPQMELMYRASEEYGMTDLSPESWADFIDRMETDDELFYRYRYNEDTRTQIPGPCTGSCRHRALCTIRTVVRDHYEDCVAQYTLLDG